MSSGGDRRRLVRDRMSQENRAALLLQQMYELDGEFAAAWDALYERFEHLIRILKDHNAIGKGRPPGGLRELTPWIEHVQSPIPVSYPRPRRATAAKEAEYERRVEVEFTLYRQLCQQWPDAWKPAEDDQRFNEELDRIAAWTLEPVRGPTRVAKSRRSRRVQVRRYFDEIARFVERWRLVAWWAIPAVIYSHFTLARLWESARGRIGSVPPLPFLISDAEIVNYYPLTVPLPDARPEYLPLEREYFAALHRQSRLDDEGHRDVILRRRPSRTEMEWVERRLGASTVNYDWEPAREPPPVDQIVAAVKSRLQRSLSKDEARELRRHVDEQVTEIRQFLRSSGGWSPSVTPDHEAHAEWVARRLLDPTLTWVQIAALHCRDDGEIPHSDMVGREARRFAREAGLELPG
jgi:hypothetical protein